VILQSTADMSEVFDLYIVVYFLSILIIYGVNFDELMASLSHYGILFGQEILQELT
jgi:hypothetical protein